MILLDTNVLSELMKAEPNQSVVAFIDGVPAMALFTSAITQAEILYGVALLPEGKRRDALRAAARTTFDNYSAAECCLLMVALRRHSRPLPPDAARAGGPFRRPMPR